MFATEKRLKQDGRRWILQLNSRGVVNVDFLSRVQNYVFYNTSGAVRKVRFCWYIHRNHRFHPYYQFNFVRQVISVV